VKYAVETLNPTRVKLSVEVPFDELKSNIDAAYRQIGSQINIPGFRKGRVPTALIDQRVGRDAVLIEAVNEALPDLYVKALEDNDLTPLSQPELDLDDIKDGASVVFRAELDVAPKITLPEFHGLEAEVEPVRVKDSDVDEQLELLRARFGSLTTVDRAAEDGDFVTIDLSAAKDGEPISEAQASGMSYQVGRGTMLEGLDESLVGMAVGDEKTFTSTLVGGEYRDQPVDVTVKVTAVKEQELPELDDEFAQTASEFDTVDELKADLRDRVTRSARIEQAEAAREAVLKKLLSLVEVPLPEGAVETEMASRRARLAEQLSYAGMTEADYLASEELTEEQYAADLETRVRDAMAAQFILEEIAKVEEMGVDESELTQLLMQRAQESGTSPEQYIKHIVDHNHLPEFVSEVRRGKALAHVVVTAVVHDTDGNHIELATLKPDGTYLDIDPQQEVSGERATTSTDAAGGIVMAGDYAVLDEDA
jgi:trigger factor